MIIISFIGFAILLFGIKPLLSSIKEKNVYAITRISSFLISCLTISIGFFLLGIRDIKIENYKTVEEYIFYNELGDIGICILKFSIFLLILVPLVFFGSVGMERSKTEEERTEIVTSFYSKNKEKLDSLCTQYYSATQRMIESLDDDIVSIFNVDTYWGRLTHKIFAKDFLSQLLVEKDGYSAPFSIDKERSNERKINNFVSALKEKIASNWENNETLNLAVYFIVRFNFIKYHSELYERNYGFDDLKDICNHSFHTKQNLNEIVRLFTYYWIFHNDINLPISKSYEELNVASKNIYAKIEAESDKEKYFGG